MLHDVIATSHMSSLYLNWYAWKEETNIYIMIPNKHILTILFWISKASGNHLPSHGKQCDKKKNARYDEVWAFMTPLDVLDSKKLHHFEDLHPPEWWPTHV